MVPFHEFFGVKDDRYEIPGAIPTLKMHFARPAPIIIRSPQIACALCGMRFVHGDIIWWGPLPHAFPARPDRSFALRERANA